MTSATKSVVRSASGLTAAFALLGCARSGAFVDPDSEGLHWRTHVVVAQRVGSVDVGGLEALARRQADDHCATLDMRVDGFAITLVKAEGEHSVRGLAPATYHTVPDQAFVHARFRCMPADRVLRPPADISRCAVEPSRELTWASMTPDGISALFDDATLLELHSIEDAPGQHALHPFDGGRLRMTSMDFDGALSALSGSYAIEGETLRLRNVRLLHEGSTTATPTCWTEIEQLDVALARPDWLEPAPSFCETLVLRQPGGGGLQVRVRRDGTAGAWTDATTGPTLETPSHRREPQLRIELRVPPRRGRYPIGDELTVEVVVEGRRMHAAGGVLNLEIQRTGELHGSFDELWLLADGDQNEGEACVLSIVPGLSWTAAAPG